MNIIKGTSTFRSSRWLAGALVLSLFWVQVKTTRCEETSSFSGLAKEVKVGVAAHDVDGLWSGSRKEEGQDLCAEVVFNRQLFRLLSATAHPNAGVSINTKGDTSKIYGGFLLQWNPYPFLSLSTGLGLTLHNGEIDTEATDKKSLGSRVLFRIPIEIGIAATPHHRFILAFDHMSNAYLASPNEGLDTLGLLYAFQF